MSDSRLLSTTRDAVRKRLSRFLNKGGVLVREDCGGAVGIRWTRATRSGSDFDTRACEERLGAGKLRRVPGSISAFGLTPPPLMMVV